MRIGSYVQEVLLMHDALNTMADPCDMWIRSYVQGVLLMHDALNTMAGPCDVWISV